MAGKVKTWVWVVVGIVVLGILGVIGMSVLLSFIFPRSEPQD